MPINFVDPTMRSSVESGIVDMRPHGRHGDMKRIILFDPSYGTSNLGDFIINRAVMQELEFLFDSNFLVRYSTHNPILSAFQLVRPSPIRRNCAEADLKFIGGTNILKNDLLKIIPGWNVNLPTARLYRGAICVGAGRAVTKEGRLNAYTRAIYRSALSRQYAHSVRDSRSQEFLEQLGFRAINTGCPTTWALTPEVTQRIRTDRAQNVVATLTDYARNPGADSAMLSTLLRVYRDVAVWVQGVNDLEYLRGLPGSEKVRVIPPSLDAFEAALAREDTEYVGTRLHAGIFAMQRSIRSTIVAVDNRASDMAESIGIHIIERAAITRLGDYLERDRKTELSIDFAKVSEWKRQFAQDV